MSLYDHSTRQVARGALLNGAQSNGATLDSVDVGLHASFLFCVAMPSRAQLDAVACLHGGCAQLGAASHAGSLPAQVDAAAHAGVLVSTQLSAAALEGPQHMAR